MNEKKSALKGKITNHNQQLANINEQLTTSSRYQSHKLANCIFAIARGLNRKKPEQFSLSLIEFHAKF